MASAFRTRLLQPALTRSSLLSTTSRQVVQRRFLNTEKAPVLYTAHARTVGARNGHIETDEGLVVDLTAPTALGGKSVKGKTNPEELFAAGYSACFQSALNLTALKMGLEIPQDSVVDCSVHLVGDLKGLDLGIRVDMKVTAKGVDKAKLEEVLEKTKEVCPYSRATQGNVITAVEAVV